MASENVEDWDQPLPSSGEESEKSDEGLTSEQRQHNKNLEKLKSYVEKMAYKPVKPISASPYTEALAKPSKRSLIDNAKQFSEYMEPPERGERIKRLASRHHTITIDEFEKVIQAEKSKERRKENIQKRKQEIYYELLTKLELQCRTQYLNGVVKKFSNFLAKLATTMHIPSTLIDPYARMHRGIFCNILQTIGVEETSRQEAIYYNNNEASDFEMCHKLSHALLSLLIKALDLAATRNPDESIELIRTDLQMDNYIKDRLMCAAEKKILGVNNKRSKRKKLNEVQDNLDKKLNQCVCNL